MAIGGMAPDEAVDLAAKLIRFDTSNDGSGAANERPAAEFVGEQLAQAGYEPVYLESAPGRGNVVARLAGSDMTRGALLVHGHLDVVPADPAQWTVPPFAGEIRDGCLWGRGAVDMKGMVAMTLAVARALRRNGVRPRRDIVFAFLADEETGGFHGAGHLVDHRPDLLAGVTEAIGEVGGFSVTLGSTARPERSGPALRIYPVQIAEKNAVWLRLTARGTGGHGSLPHPGSAVATLVAAVTRLSEHRFPTILTAPVRQFLTGVSRLTGWPFDEDDPDALVARLGGMSRMLSATLRDTANITMLEAGLAPNVVPDVARATVDGRALPGREEAFQAEVAAVLGPEIEMDWRSLPPAQATFDGPLVDAIIAAVDAEDPDAAVLPYLVSASTDAKSLARLGIRHYGFAPLRLPPELDFLTLFHGVDERVPVEALQFGTRVLYRLLSSV
jgi:acetylornithine deacetylase/succinyl-diaminopimelate desuccinylase-like protein